MAETHFDSVTFALFVTLFDIGFQLADFLISYALFFFFKDPFDL